MAGYLLLCPGQGAQHPGMLDFALATPEGREAMDEASAAAHVDIAARVREGADLFEPVFAQVCVVATALASWRAIEKRVPVPAAIAGYSVGEVSAWGCAGAWSVAGTTSLTMARARLMLAASPPDCAMVAITGVDGATLERLRGPGTHVAIEVDTDHWILAGRRADLDAAVAALGTAGGVTHTLPVTVPSHTPLLESAATALRPVIEAMGGSPPASPVLRGVDGRMLDRVEEAAGALAQAVCRTIRWRSVMDEAAEREFAVSIELPPGSALTRMALARGRPEARALADFRSPEGAARWLERAG